MPGTGYGSRAALLVGDYGITQRFGKGDPLPFLAPVATAAARMLPAVGRTAVGILKKPAVQAGSVIVPIAASPATRTTIASTIRRVAGSPAAAAAGAAGATALAMGGFDGRPKRRRMNPLNPAALRRANRRQAAFREFVKKTDCGCNLKPKKRRASCR